MGVLTRERNTLVTILPSKKKSENLGKVFKCDVVLEKITFTSFYFGKKSVSLSGEYTHISV